MSRPARSRAYRRGRRAEALCAWWLRLHGYRVLSRGYRGREGEIDIVARRGRVLVMVEVKARASLAEAGAAVTRRQKSRIARAAARYLAQHPRRAGLAVRFDVVLIAPWHAPRHLVDAWRPGLDGVNR